jgi:1-acyl-sn-glycerol-3-phosphate acyltransferase
MDSPVQERSQKREVERKLITRSTPVYRIGRTLTGLELLVLHRMQVEGKENLPAGPVLLISNHQSFLDIPLVANAARPRHVCFVARETLADSRFLGWVMHHSGVVLIKRGGADRAALRKMVGHLRADDSVCIFPEGTRSRDGSLGEFKAGALFAAKRARVPIVPTGIRGGCDAYPRTAALPRPGRIGIRFGKPLDPRSTDALEQARSAIQHMIGDGSFASGEASP